ncbi:MAG: hypothetical protein Q8M66_09260, partial [Actinomycetota bacterium]|nr:hypothetical protein [Actinomycetota bacterium]
SLWDYANLNVDGLVAFDRVPVGGNPAVTSVTPSLTGNSVVVTAWEMASVPSTSITTNANGILTGWGPTVTPAAGSAKAVVGSGSGAVNWGVWAGGSIVNDSFSYSPGNMPLYWITAPEPTPVYLSQVLTTTNASYTSFDGAASDSLGNNATAVNASLTVNFTTQTVAANLDATVNGHYWQAATNNMPLKSSNGNSQNAFSADSYRNSGQPGFMNVTVDGQTAQGSLAGQLVGAALDGAILKFNLEGQVTIGGSYYDYMHGVAALAADAPNDPATAYRAVMFSISEPMALRPTVMVGGSYNNAGRVIADGSGNLTQFDDSTGGGSSTIQYANAGTGTGFVDQGSAVIGGATVRWGRWDSGTVVNVQDRTTQVWQNGIVLSGGAHAVVGPVMTAPVGLPSGT